MLDLQHGLSVQGISKALSIPASWSTRSGLYCDDLHVYLLFLLDLQGSPCLESVKFCRHQIQNDGLVVVFIIENKVQFFI